MSKKHFDSAAKMIREKYPHNVDRRLRAETARFLADFFAAHGERFVRERFMKACEVE